MEQRERYPETPPIPERAGLIESLRKELNSNPGRKLSSEDQVAIAHALHSMMRRILRDKGVASATILKKAGIEEGSKYLAQYAIREGASPNRLRKKVGAYTKITKEAAKLAGIDEGEAFLEVFGRAAFWQTAGTRVTSLEFEDLCDKLRFVMGAVAREHRLTEYFN